MDRGAWWATVHGVTKSRTQLSDFIFTFMKAGGSFLFNNNGGISMLVQWLTLLFQCRGVGSIPGLENKFWKLRPHMPSDLAKK